MALESSVDIVPFAAWAATQGGVWQLTPWQGCNSVTFRNDRDGLILQFRDHTKEALSASIVELVKDIHSRWAPRTHFRGTMPQQPNYGIWQMELMPGDPYLFHVQDIESAKVALTVTDFAKFFADQWRSPQKRGDPTKALLQYKTQLHELLTALPVTFSAAINDTIESLDSIMELPSVVTHSDLSCGNILIDPSTGHILGIVDWAETTFEPFGLSLYGLQDIIGFHDENGYHYLEGADTNLKIFRRVFLQGTNIQTGQASLEQARMLGVLLRYGFIWNPEIRMRSPPTEPKDLEFLRICLDAHIFEV